MSISSKRAVALLCFALSSGALAMEQWSSVAINGQRLTVQELNLLQQQIGTYVSPGSYLFDGNSGCWYNQSTGASGCLGGNGSYLSRYGSGHSNASDWNHWSNAAGGAVGGTSDGCVYTSFGWSNC
jgi:hypothetical protein